MKNRWLEISFIALLFCCAAAISFSEIAWYWPPLPTWLMYILVLPLIWIIGGLGMRLLELCADHWPKRRRDLIKIRIGAVLIMLIPLAMGLDALIGREITTNSACLLSVFAIASVGMYRYSVSEWKRRQEQEEHWQKMVKSENFWEVLQKPDLFREDFMEWLRETNPNALLQLKNQPDFKFPKDSSN